MASRRQPHSPSAPVRPHGHWNLPDTRPRRADQHHSTPSKIWEGGRGGGWVWLLPPLASESPCGVSLFGQRVLAVLEVLRADASQGLSLLGGRQALGPSPWIPYRKSRVPGRAKERQNWAHGEGYWGAGVLGHPSVCMGFEVLGGRGQARLEVGGQDEASTQSHLLSLLPVFSSRPGCCVFRVSRVLGSILAQTQACWMMLDRSQPQYPHL